MTKKGDTAALLSSIGIKRPYIKCLIIDNISKRIEGVVNVTSDEQYFNFKNSSYSIDTKNSYIMDNNIRMLVYNYDDYNSKEIFKETGDIVPAEIMRLYIERAQLLNLLNKDTSTDVIKYIIIAGVILTIGYVLFSGM